MAVNVAEHLFQTLDQAIRQELLPAVQEPRPLKPADYEHARAAIEQAVASRKSVLFAEPIAKNEIEIKRLTQAIDGVVLSRYALGLLDGRTASI